MKKSITILLTIALLFAFAAFALGSADSDEATVEKSSQSQETATSKSKAKEEKETKVKVGETLNANGMKITYDSAEKWTSDNQFIQPGEGKQYIRLHFSITNNTKSDQYIGSTDFECYADGTKCETVYTGEDTLSLDSISSGRKISGYVYYEVPTNASEIEVEYETSIWTNKKAYFIVKL